jgi:hypothetical protein
VLPQELKISLVVKGTLILNGRAGSGTHKAGDVGKSRTLTDIASCARGLCVRPWVLRYECRWNNAAQLDAR